jgi:hypothetical protein
MRPPMVLKHNYSRALKRENVLISWGVDFARLHFTIVQRTDPLLLAIFESADSTGRVLFLSLQR